MADDNTPYPEEGHPEGCKGQPYASPAEACDIAMTRSERRRLGWGGFGVARMTKPGFSSFLSAPRVEQDRRRSVNPLGPGAIQWPSALRRSVSHPPNHSPTVDLARV